MRHPTYEVVAGSPCPHYPTVWRYRTGHRSGSGSGCRFFAVWHIPLCGKVDMPFAYSKRRASHHKKKTEDQAGDTHAVPLHTFRHILKSGPTVRQQECPHPSPPQRTGEDAPPKEKTA